MIFFFNDHGQLAKAPFTKEVSNPSIVCKADQLEPLQALVSNVDFAPTIWTSHKLIIQNTNLIPKFPLPGRVTRKRLLYFELGYARGVRIGDWKYMAIRYPKAIEKRP